MNESDTDLTVSLKLDLPDDQVFGAELDLIEQYLGEVLREMLIIEGKE